MSKFFPEAISACKEQLKTFASHANHSHSCLVELYIKLITSLRFFKIGIKNHTSDWSELSGKARVSIMKQMLIERPIIYLPRKNSATASDSICDHFFVLEEWCQWLTLLFCQHWLNITIPPKLHLLEDYAVDFMER